VEQRQYDEAVTSIRNWIESTLAKLNECNEVIEKASDVNELELR